MALPHLSIGKPGQPLNSKLNVAFIGVGGRGKTYLNPCLQRENIVALCNVDEVRMKEALDTGSNGFPELYDKPSVNPGFSPPGPKNHETRNNKQTGNDLTKDGLK